MNPPLTLETLWQTLGTILDPEFGLSIVDLGLVYDVVLDGDRVSVAMTLTSPACPAGGMIVDGTRAALAALPGVSHVDVALVWEPPWTPARLTQGGRDQLGWQEIDM
ncbi:MAG TPA: metal-sulfur cluster assembly factor [Opitutaceae bacterium]